MQDKKANVMCLAPDLPKEANSRALAGGRATEWGEVLMV
jgi:hypothetical protein